MAHHISQQLRPFKGPPDTSTHKEGDSGLPRRLERKPALRMRDTTRSTRRLLLSLLSVISLATCHPKVDHFGLPGYTPEDNIVHHYAYTLKYSEDHEQAAWVAYKLTAERVMGTCERTDDFRPDPMVTTGSADLSDYRGSGYDRGHLAPAADMKWSPTAMSESFYMSNMSPQRPGFNRGIWKKLEVKVRTWATENEVIYIVTGPVLSDNLPTIGVNQVAVPEYYYKVILDFEEPELKGIGFILANQSSTTPLQDYAVTIDSVEVATGIDFFPAIEDSSEQRIESSIEMETVVVLSTKGGEHSARGGDFLFR